MTVMLNNDVLAVAAWRVGCFGSQHPSYLAPDMATRNADKAGWSVKAVVCAGLIKDGLLHAACSHAVFMDGVHFNMPA